MPPTLTYKIKKARGISPVARIPNIIRAGAIVIQNDKAIAMNFIPKGTFLGYVFPHSILRKKINFCHENDKDNSIILQQKHTGEVLVCKLDKETHFSANMLFFVDDFICNIKLMADSSMYAIRDIDMLDEITCFLGPFQKCFVDQNQNLNTNQDSAWYKECEIPIWDAVDDLIDAILITERDN